jgi:hypothetical protein
MPEIYINILVVLILYLVANFIRTKYADRVSVPIRRGIYIGAIAYFLFITIYYFDRNGSSGWHLFKIIAAVIVIGFLFYKMITLTHNA